MASPENNKDFIEKVKRLRETKLGQKDVVPIQAVGEKKPSFMVW